ncbi:hypothetical protein NDU88_007577 [Pleurodeles waltl]|uniref:Uncharacterized protein n=1 Tax=Pleurodeles waltl TaxID=8319 RepID=A0AAV7N6Q9_PLEWA|nr:hypothetical protein NDU88_007577 [Pleurodeles waltl]
MAAINVPEEGNIVVPGLQTGVLRPPEHVNNIKEGLYRSTVIGRLIQQADPDRSAGGERMLEDAGRNALVREHALDWGVTETAGSSMRNENTVHQERNDRSRSTTFQSSDPGEEVDAVTFNATTLEGCGPRQVTAPHGSVLRRWWAGVQPHQRGYWGKVNHA